MINHNVAGIDLGSKEHFVCGPAKDKEIANVERFGCTTPQLMKMVEWLKQQVESVAMESTGVYWIPLYEILEQAGFEVLLVNARQLSNVPGRKADVVDCQWIQLLHRCGLLRGSFRPDDQICAIRTLQREAMTVIAGRTQAIQGMQKSLDQMNVLVHRARSDITGATEMRIVRAIIAGERNPTVLADMRDVRCKKSVSEMIEYLPGNWRHEHLFNLKMALANYDHLNELLLGYDAEIQKQISALVPGARRDESPPEHSIPRKIKDIRSSGNAAVHQLLYQVMGADLTRIHGINIGTVQVTFSEVGADLSSFPSEGH